MAIKFDPILGKLRQADSITGNLDLGTDYLIMQAPGGTRYQISVDDTGALVTEEIIVTGLTGQPTGLMLLLTYA